MQSGEPSIFVVCSLHNSLSHIKGLHSDYGNILIKHPEKSKLKQKESSGTNHYKRIMPGLGGQQLNAGVADIQKKNN